MIEFIIPGILALGAAILVGMTMHRRLGPAVWPFLLILVPASLILILAEAEVAKGALAILLGSLSGAYGIALVVALAMLLAAHWLGDAVIEYLDGNINYGGNLYNGASWQPSRLALALIAFLALAFVYGYLGYIRTGIPAGILGASVITPLARYIFFIYPIVSLIIGLFTAQTIRTMKAHYQRWLDAQSACFSVRVALIGRVSNDELRRILRMVEQRVLNGESLSDIISGIQNQAADYYALTSNGNNAPGIPGLIPTYDEQLSENMRNGW
jgi:hypothetical protein